MNRLSENTRVVSNCEISDDVPKNSIGTIVYVYENNVNEDVHYYGVEFIVSSHLHIHGYPVVETVRSDQIELL